MEHDLFMSNLIADHIVDCANSTAKSLVELDVCERDIIVLAQIHSKNIWLRTNFTSEREVETARP